MITLGLASDTGEVYRAGRGGQRLPTAVLSTGLMIVAVLSISSGLVLDTVTRGRREMKLLAYLSQPPAGKRPDWLRQGDGPRPRRMLSPKNLVLTRFLNANRCPLRLKTLCHE